MNQVRVTDNPVGQTAAERAATRTRELIEHLVRLDADDPFGDDIARTLETLIAGSPVDPSTVVGVEPPSMMVDRSPVSGRVNPLAPPVSFELTADNRGMSTVTLGLAYQGPPGRVHGGYVATLLDHVMGYTAGLTTGDHKFTRTLSVDYSAGTPLFVPMTISAWVESEEGRKAWIRGEISVDGTVTASARGLFVGARI